MKCHICGKENAAIFVNEIANGEKKSYYLCEECASKKTSEGGLLLAGLLNALTAKSAFGEAVVSSPEGEEPSPAACPACSWTEEQFRKTGRLGCPACGKAFQELLSGLLAAIQRESVHKGKCPCRPAAGKRRIPRAGEELRPQISVLRELLALAVSEERYEDAALLRDQIAASEHAENMERQDA